MKCGECNKEGVSYIVNWKHKKINIFKGYCKKCYENLYED